MKLKNLVVLFGHCMETWFRQLVVIIVVADWHLLHGF